MKKTHDPRNDAVALTDWYRANKRNLPWRQNRDPYRIWLSEVMLQQTTVAAVIPYYERFLERFPKIETLARAPIEDVIAAWAGLGYYSRARNLHKAANAIVENGGFPRDLESLLALPGFGPYTARAVASLAFDVKVGVLDGNVIRVLCRKHGLDVEWWKPREREKLQKIADELAQFADPSDLNQGLMELGATICTPRNPACLLCPWERDCVARLSRKIEVLPKKKPRREREVWIWHAEVLENQDQVGLIKNEYAPFLKGHLICPGKAKRVAEPPKTYDYKGTVTHHDIFVIVSSEKEQAAKKTRAAIEIKWVKRAELKKWVPTSLIRKALESRTGR